MKNTLFTALGALLFCGGVYAQGSDACGTAQPIGGCGTFAFNTTAAGQDGLPDAMCFKFATSQIDHDVWFTWRAPNSGPFVANTCGGTLGDTKMAVYSDMGACPPSPALDCNDDTCGLQSQVSWGAMAGQSYLIRVGSFPGSAGTTGTFAITGCAPSVGMNYCVSTINSTGAESVIRGTGSPSIAANNLTLCANNLPAQPGIFIAGPTPASTPFYCGVLCVGFGGLQRFGTVNFPGPNGNICELVNYAMSAPGGLSVVAGMTHHYQRWNRDPAGMPTCMGPGTPSPTANFSDGLMVLHTP